MKVISVRGDTNFALPCPSTQTWTLIIAWPVILQTSLLMVETVDSGPGCLGSNPSSGTESLSDLNISFHVPQFPYLLKEPY